MADDFYTCVDDGVRLAVRLTPRAARTEVVGPVEDAGGRAALGIRIAAPPVEGAANDALVRFVAKAAGLPRSAVSIQSGEKSRTKILLLRGDADAIAGRLRTLR